MPTLSGPEYLNGQFSVAADGTISLTTAPLPIGGGSMTGPIMLPAGTAAANSVQIVNPGTGMFGIAAGNQLAFATSGVERVRIDNNGNVGIGTTTPAAQLDIAGPYIAATGNEIVIQATGTQTVASTGALIAGNLSPTYNAASGTLNVLMGLNAAPGNSSTGTVTTLTGAVIQPQNFAGGTVGTMRGVFIQPSNNAGGTVSFMYGLNSTVINGGAGQTTNLYGLYTRTNNTNAAGVVTNAYGLYIDTAVSTGTITNKWGVYQADATTPNYFNGNVGIGTTGPAAKLDVVGTIYARGSGGGLVVVDRVNTANFSQIYRTGDTTRFWDSGSAGDVLVYNAAGNVGIGTPTPSVKLDVGGGVAARNAGMPNPSFYAGLSGNVNFSGVLLGSGTNGNSPTIAASPDGNGNLGSLLFYAGNSQRMTILSGGQVIINTGTQSGAFTVNGSCANITGAWTTISDASVKQEVQPYTRGLDAIVALKPVQFRYVAGTPFTEGDKPSHKLFGLIADDVKPHVPEIVGTVKTTIGKKEGVELSTLEPGNLIYALINAVKELNGQREEMVARIAALESATVH